MSLFPHQLPTAGSGGMDWEQAPLTSESLIVICTETEDEGRDPTPTGGRRRRRTTRTTPMAVDADDNVEGRWTETHSAFAHFFKRQVAIQIIDNHYVMIHQALAGLMAGNNVPDRGKRKKQRELDPHALVTARNLLSDCNHGFLWILLVYFLLASTTTAHAFSAAPGSPNFSNFPRKQTWVAPKAPPELMNDMYQVHGATELVGTIEVFDFIGEGTRASESSVDLKLMGPHSIVELHDGLPTKLAANDAEGQEFPIDATVQEIHDDGAKLLSATSLMPFYVEEDGAVKPFNFGTDVEEAEDPNPTRLCNMKAYINILSGPNDNNEIDNIETDDASVVRCEETADMAVPEGGHGSLVQNTMVVCAAPTQSWKAEHSEKALPTDKATRASKPAVD
ncbi:hypothetical protein THAOC_28760, partial [Thalassiosira oceanica]